MLPFHGYFMSNFLEAYSLLRSLNKSCHSIGLLILLIFLSPATQFSSTFSLQESGSSYFLFSGSTCRCLQALEPKLISQGQINQCKIDQEDTLTECGYCITQRLCKALNYHIEGLERLIDDETNFSGGEIK